MARKKKDKKYEKSVWVTGRRSGAGQVIGWTKGAYHVRWLGTGKAERVGVRALKKARLLPCGLLLEGSLDSDLTSRRSEERLLAEWLESIGHKLAHKTVHSVDDLFVLAPRIRKTNYLFAHFNCHGKVGSGKDPRISLAPDGEWIDLLEADTVEAFRECFSGRAVLFSACDLGKYQGAMLSFKRRAGLKHVAAYTRPVYDYEAALVDLCIYQGILHHCLTFRTAVERAVAGFQKMGILGTPGQALLKVF